MKPLITKLVVLCIAASILTLVSCNAKNDVKTSSELNVYNWAYYLPEELKTKFTAETGIKLNYKEFFSNEEMYATIASGDNSWDIVLPSQDWVPVMIEKGLVVELDKTLIPNFSNIDQAILDTTNQFDSGNKFSVPYNIGASAIVYWKDKVKVDDADKSWKILERADVKGHTSMNDDMREVLGAALKSLGYSLNTTDAGEIAKAAEVVQKWKANALKPFDADSIGRNFASKDYWAVFCFPENIMTEVPNDQRDNVGIFFPKEGGPKYLDSMMILKTGKNTANAYKFINFILQPENLAVLADTFGYPGISSKANALRKAKPYYSLEELKDRDLKMNVGPAIDVWNKAWEEKIKIGQ